jgi:hypothetical protein
MLGTKHASVRVGKASLSTCWTRPLSYPVPRCTALVTGFTARLVVLTWPLMACRLSSRLGATVSLSTAAAACKSGAAAVCGHRHAAGAPMHSSQLVCRRTHSGEPTHDARTFLQVCLARAARRLECRVCRLRCGGGENEERRAIGESEVA